MPCTTGRCALPLHEAPYSTPAAGTTTPGSTAPGPHAQRLAGSGAPLSAPVVSRRRYESIDDVLSEMGRLVRAYRTEPVVRRAADAATANLASALDPASVALAIFEAVRQWVRYVPDPHRTEFIQSPDVLLRERMGDCDDLTVLVEAMCQSFGLPTRAVVAGFEGDDGFTHVWPEVDLSGEGSGWYPLDVTLGEAGATVLPHAVRVRVYDADDGRTLHLERSGDGRSSDPFPSVLPDADLMEHEQLGNPFGGSGFPAGGGFGFDPTGGAGGFGFDPTGGAGGFGFESGFGFDSGFDFDGGFGSGFGFGQHTSNFSIPGLGEITPEALQGWLGVFDQLAQTLGWGRHGGGQVRAGHVLVRDQNGRVYEVPREEAERLAEQGVLIGNDRDGYAVNPSAGANGQGPRIGGAQQSGFGRIGTFLVIGAGLGLMYVAARNLGRLPDNQSRRPVLR